eukprot:g3309.t1
MGCLVSAIAFGPRPETPRELLLQLQGHPGLLKLQSRWGTIPALWMEHRRAELTILYSHGNAEDIAEGIGSIARLSADLKANVLAYEYTGYSLSSHKTPSERNCYADIAAAYEYLTNVRRIPPAKIVLYGRSLGSGPTVHQAMLVRRGLGGMILQSPLVSAVGTQTGECCCTRVLSCWDLFRNYAKIHRVEFPVFIMHGTADGVVPCSNGRAIYRRLQNPHPPLWCKGCGHNDMEYRMGETMVAKMREFLAAVVAGRAGAAAAGAAGRGRGEGGRVPLVPGVDVM